MVVYNSSLQEPISVNTQPLILQIESRRIRLDMHPGHARWSMTCARFVRWQTICCALMLLLLYSIWTACVQPRALGLFGYSTMPHTPYLSKPSAACTCFSRMARSLAPASGKATILLPLH